MVIIDACRDFVEGLARGFSLFLTERHDGDLTYTVPEAALAQCLRPQRPGAVTSPPPASSGRSAPPRGRG